MRKIITATIIVLLLFVGARSLTAAETAAEKKDPLHIYRSAGINIEQEAKIRQIAQEYDKAGRVRVERLRKLSKQMKDLSYEAELDAIKILSIQTEINEIQTSINTERTKLMLRIRGILSNDQKEKLVDLMRENDPQAPAKKIIAAPSEAPGQAAPSSTEQPAAGTPPVPSPQ